MKERLGLTEIRKHANRMTFAEVSLYFCLLYLISCMFTRVTSLPHFNLSDTTLNPHNRISLTTCYRYSAVFYWETLDPGITWMPVETNHLAMQKHLPNDYKPPGHTTLREHIQQDGVCLHTQKLARNSWRKA